MLRRLALVEIETDKWRVVDETDGHAPCYREYTTATVAHGIPECIADCDEREAALAAEAGDVWEKAKFPDKSIVKRMLDLAPHRPVS